MKDLDLICIGRCNVDLYVDQIGARLRDAQSFSKYVGGSAANICLGASHLGLKAAMITRVGDDQLGEYIREAFRRKGSDVSYIISDASLMTPQIFLAIHEASGFERFFDYPENASDMGLTEEDISADFIGSAKALLVNGTHLSRPNLEAATRKAIAAAKNAGTKVAFDIDYRPGLWGLTQLADSANMFIADETTTLLLQSILPDCDLVVGTEEEIHILGGSEDTYQALQNIRALTDAAVVLKRGAQGSVVFDGAIPENFDSGIKGPVFPVEVFNATGAGDGFMAGFLRGWVNDEPYETCCTYANACGALVVSRHGCAPAVPSWEELQYFLSLEKHPVRPGEDVELNHIHWATATRRKHSGDLNILAFDHRWQFEEMAQGDSSQVMRAKELIAKAFSQLAGQYEGCGAIVDGQYGRNVFETLNGEGHWLAQAIEIPRKTPLEFVGGVNVGLTLNTWPEEHIVKCLAFFPAPDVQVERLHALYEACRVLGRELLLEVLPADGAENTDDFAADVMRDLYARGIRPDWWKLEAPPSDAGWARITATIEENDPYCLGVLLLGKAATPAELGEQFTLARSQGICRGFAIGRTIFADPVQRWLAGDIGDDALVTEVANNTQELISLWHTDYIEERKAAS